MLRKASRISSRLLTHGSRSFGKVYQPKEDFGPTYYESLRYKELLNEERRQNAELYKKRQAEMDFDYVSTLLYLI